MRDREAGGSHAFKVLMTVVLLSLVAFCFWWALPNWLVRPNAEATTGQYQDAADISNHGPENYVQLGKCNALSMDVAKALNDRRLTAYEVHVLKNKAYDLAVESTKVSARNRALEATGNKATEAEIDCSYGLSLFAY